MAAKRNAGNDWTQMDRRFFLTTAAQLAGMATASTLLPGGLLRLARAAEEGKPTAVVSTKSGKMRGLTIDGVHTFRGVPYGAPTGGERRFLRPLPPQAWTDVRDMYDWGPYAPPSGRARGAKQMEFWSTLRPASKLGSSEDCLYLNVWTRALDGPKRPVMVWLHGGGYDQGSGGSPGYAGEGLAKNQDVVSISLNHRLNVLGYLYLGGILGSEFAESANQGQLDIVAALQWVKVNIEAFGGDPSRVMIYGQSGGGGKVANLLGMPSAKGLFTAAAMQSGGGGASDKDRATQSAEELLKRFDLTRATARDLQKVPLDKLMAIAAGAAPAVSPGAAPPAEGRGRGGRGGAGGGFSFSPVNDGTIIPSASPVNSEISASVPVIVGSTRTENTIYQVDSAGYDKMTDEALLASVKASAGEEKAAQVIEMLKKKNPKASNYTLSLYLGSERRQNGPSVAEGRNRLNKAPTYTYRWDWETPVMDLHAPHTMEIPFVMNHIDACTSMVGPVNAKMKELEAQAAGAWVALATTGNPNHSGLPNWPAYNAQTKATMVFDSPCRVENDLGHELRQLIGDGPAGGRGARGARAT